jgi:hypothetical protein
MSTATRAEIEQAFEEGDFPTEEEFQRFSRAVPNYADDWNIGLRTHNPAATYRVGECCVYNDQLYLALDNVPAATPITDGNYWTLINSAGLGVQLVADLNNPTELNSLGNEAGLLLYCREARSGEADRLTIYLYDNDPGGVDSPYVVQSAGGGRWIAIAGYNKAIGRHKQLIVLGSIQNSGTLTQVGEATFEDTVVMQQALQVQGATELQDGADIQGQVNITDGGLLVTGNTVIGGITQLNDETIVNAALAVNGPVTHDGDQSTSGVMTINGEINGNRIRLRNMGNVGFKYILNTDQTVNITGSGLTISPEPLPAGTFLTRAYGLVITPFTGGTSGGGNLANLRVHHGTGGIQNMGGELSQIYNAIGFFDLLNPENKSGFNPRRGTAEPIRLVNTGTGTLTLTGPGEVHFFFEFGVAI